MNERPEPPLAPDAADTEGHMHCKPDAADTEATERRLAPDAADTEGHLRYMLDEVGTADGTSRTRTVETTPRATDGSEHSTSRTGAGGDARSLQGA